MRDGQPYIHPQLKVSVLLFNLSDSRPAKLTTPLNKVKRLLELCLGAPLMCRRTPSPPVPPSALANSSPQKLLALMPYIRLISKRYFVGAPIKVPSCP
ncbi:unnamed protein product [Pieris brassicae]|uniref:Uncharacterized protein n=1 Tax=Pieris brassicae TaxID=7116 RepID=A0A9P0SF90_PIEBR|nr:unnamed protein product [Pieris brassicae]